MRVVLCAVLVAMTGSSMAVATQQESAASDAESQAPKTLKERLGDKASDDQRVDNCKVPAERRGSKSRPDECVR
ncbi:hypothetical protein AWB67_00242 [Caballeronia terrestris]|uniref:Phosphate starvation-inducible protein PsiF n=2 Tax=Caballeronia terrestris TaxID=1226301 RepID=A0A158F137_9BURK|nr:hypothetical protein AWB67_00242 [Caballeronia terrestris]